MTLKGSMVYKVRDTPANKTQRRQFHLDVHNFLQRTAREATAQFLIYRSAYTTASTTIIQQ